MSSIVLDLLGLIRSKNEILVRMHASPSMSHLVEIIMNCVRPSSSDHGLNGPACWDTSSAVLAEPNPQTPSVLAELSLGAANYKTPRPPHADPVVHIGCLYPRVLPPCRRRPNHQNIHQDDRRVCWERDGLYYRSRMPNGLASKSPNHPQYLAASTTDTVR